MSMPSSFSSLWPRSLESTTRRAMPLSADRILWVVVRVAIAFALATWACTAKEKLPKPIPAPEVKPVLETVLSNLVLVKSEFEVSETSGKDPFFPNSDRIRKQNSHPQDSAVAPLPKLELKGISISRSQRLVILNNYTMAEGEERDLRVDGGYYRIRCVEVREQSVVVGYLGQNHEITLPPTL